MVKDVDSGWGDVYGPIGARIPAFVAEIFGWSKERTFAACFKGVIGQSDAERAHDVYVVFGRYVSAPGIAVSGVVHVGPSTMRFRVANRAAFEAWCVEVRRSYAEQELTR